MRHEVDNQNLQLDLIQMADGRINTAKESSCSADCTNIL